MEPRPRRDTTRRQEGGIYGYRQTSRWAKREACREDTVRDDHAPQFCQSGGGNRGVGQAKAVIFFVVVAAISIIQLQASRRKEVQQ